MNLSTSRWMHAALLAASCAITLLLPLVPAPAHAQSRCAFVLGFSTRRMWARCHDQRARRERRVRVLLNLMWCHSAAPTLQDFLQCCVEAIVRHLDAAFARVWTVDEAARDNDEALHPVHIGRPGCLIPTPAGNDLGRRDAWRCTVCELGTYLGRLISLPGRLIQAIPERRGPNAADQQSLGARASRTSQPAERRL